MKLQPRAFPALPQGVTLRDLDAGDKGRVTVRTDGEAPIIGVHDTIEAGFAGRISEALRQIGPRPVLLEVNSRGGDLFESLGAMNALLQHPAPVRARITGLAASGASLLVMGAGQIELLKTATVMVHNAQGLVMGDHHVMAEAAKIFEGFSATVRSIYAERTGLEEKTVGQLMDDGVYMNSERAKKLGFVDTIVDPPAPNADAQRRRDLKAALRAQGLTRSQVRKAVSSIYGHDDDDDALDVARIAAALNSGLEAYLGDPQ